MYLRAAVIYTHNVRPHVLPTATLKEVIVEITEKRLGVTAVTDEQNRVVGIITDGDLRRMLEKSNNIQDIKAADILSAYPKTIPPDMLAVDTLDVLRKYDISQLIVAEDEKYLGILHIHDLVKEGII